MTITREITRVDFVKQADGSTVFCVEVTEVAPDPFNKGEMLRRRVEPAPMTPEMALERFGFTLSDIVQGINEAAVAENAAHKTNIADMAVKISEIEAENTDHKTSIAALSDQIAEFAAKKENTDDQE